MISILASEKFQKNFIAYVDKKEKLCSLKKPKK